MDLFERFEAFIEWKWKDDEQHSTSHLYMFHSRKNIVKIFNVMCATRRKTSKANWKEAFWKEMLYRDGRIEQWRLSIGNYGACVWRIAFNLLRESSSTVCEIGQSVQAINSNFRQSI